MSVSYKSLGLVNTKELFKDAMARHYAVPAYNFSSLEQFQGILQACVESASPVILQISKGARMYTNPGLLKALASGAVEYTRFLGKEIPIVLHLDHGNSFELCKECIDNGFSSVMIDGSALAYEENIALTKQVVDYAHQFGVSVEGELGVLSGVEDEVNHNSSHYTKPEEVQDFVAKTGVDSLAISIGTSHGAYKFKPGTKPQIRLDILKQIEAMIPGFPIVLHGSSSVPQNLVAEINTYGGKMENAIGIPEEQLREAAKSAVCKINIDSDGRLAMLGAMRKHLANNPGEIDPRNVMGPARDALKALYKEKNSKVLGSAGMA